MWWDERQVPAISSETSSAYSDRGPWPLAVLGFRCFQVGHAQELVTFVTSKCCCLNGQDAAGIAISHVLVPK